MSFKVKQSGKKLRPLEKMFNKVPERYDMVNRIITWGQDERWRKHAARECLSGDSSSILDLCTGTGDLALRLARFSDDTIRISALDYSEPMLGVARRKARKKGIDRVVFTRGDAADLPYLSSSLDSVGISFAFRNLTYKNPDMGKFLSEIYRVIRDQGKFVIVESSQPKNRIVRVMFRVYLKVFVAGLAGWISGQKGAYRYLAASARNYYEPSEIQDLLLKTGFSRVEHKPFMLGVAGLTVAVK
jgi:demethylmenaquinone methyltransferase/2-methoxy-6-polyprenyl-1,4-benzoquinol methylase